MISRDLEQFHKNQKGFKHPAIVRDARHIYRMHGPLAFFSGIVPYATNHVLNNLEIFGDTDSQYADPMGKKWLYFTLLFSNPLNIMIVRMQCVEFPLRSLRAAWVDMVKNDGLKMFYKGLFPTFTGQILLWLFVGLAANLEDLNSYYTPYLCGTVFLMGCAACHPWQLIGMRIQYQRFSMFHKEGYSNTLKGILFVKQTQGLKGLWRGFLPAMLINGSTYYQELNRMVFSKLKPRVQSYFKGVK
ncbi:hypothetical protein FGO68_gene363 [Halteria grandinella]|uniref:Uncharacterized protein n=1 Tax=Halteria grandinella TaxID=5974 RepID=A0A8J8NJR9_HALGN|nr:hypothetical protein FGO68_gene363 [Halteria grandinella]